MQHNELTIEGLRSDILERKSVGRRIDQLRALDEGSWLSEPSWIPERSDFATRLIPCAGPSVEAVKRRCLKK